MSTGHAVDASPRGITARLTVNETMERWPATIRAMRRYGMQPGCCGGLTLAAVAERSGLNVTDLVDALREAAASNDPRADARHFVR